MEEMPTLLKQYGFTTRRVDYRFYGLAFPFWANKLILNGHFLAALGIAAVISACVYGFVLASVTI